MKLLFLFLLPAIGFAQTISTMVNDPATKFTDDMILDQNGNLYCSDYSGTSVYKMTPDGTVSTFATGLNTPNGLAFDSQGNLFVADNVGNHIYKLSSAGAFLDTFDITNPSGLIKLNGSDTLLVTTYTPSGLVKLAPDGTFVPVYSNAPLNGPVGMAYAPSGELYLANFSNGIIFRVALNPFQLDSITTIPGNAGGSAVVGFIEYSLGYIWATCYNTHKIYRVDPSNGQVALVAGSVAGSNDGPANTATFNRPNGICATADGDTLFVSDYNTGRLRVISGYTLVTETKEELVLNSFPNPFESVWIVEFPETVENGKITLFTMNGELLETIVIEKEKQFSVDWSNLTPGTYSVTLEADGKVMHQRITKL